ncbi:hypothetical protein [Microvirus mar2]|uniref:Uncharacterized protein n=1 Tax=Microvirus mar2 TaxID=2851152 RepID=A0A8F5RAU2_9VIRU|nr:hypothetical protein [Microvirus mar2]
MLTMTKIRTPFTYDPADYIGEVNELDSLTVPDQALSIKEIVDYSRSGIDLGLSRYKRLYDDDLGDSNLDNFEPIEVNDIVDAQQLQLQNELEYQQRQAKAASEAKNEQNEQPQLPLDDTTN